MSFLYSATKNAALDFLFMQEKTCSLDKLERRAIFSDVAWSTSVHRAISAFITADNIRLLELGRSCRPNAEFYKSVCKYHSRTPGTVKNPGKVTLLNSEN